MQRNMKTLSKSNIEKKKKTRNSGVLYSFSSTRNTSVWFGTKVTFVSVTLFLKSGIRILVLICVPCVARSILFTILQSSKMALKTISTHCCRWVKTSSTTFQRKVVTNSEQWALFQTRNKHTALKDLNSFFSLRAKQIELTLFCFAIGATSGKHYHEHVNNMVRTGNKKNAESEKITVITMCC